MNHQTKFTCVWDYLEAINLWVTPHKWVPLGPYHFRRENKLIIWFVISGFWQTHLSSPEAPNRNHYKTPLFDKDTVWAEPRHGQHGVCLIMISKVIRGNCSSVKLFMLHISQGPDIEWKGFISPHLKALRAPRVCSSVSASALMTFSTSITHYSYLSHHW